MFNDKFKKIKVILILIFILLIISTVFLLLKNRRTSEKENIPQSKLSSQYSGSFSVDLKVARENFSFPTKLPLISISPLSNISEYFTRASEKLGFSGGPLSSEDVFDGRILFWNNDTTSLFAYQKSGLIKYTQRSLPQTINKQLTDQDLVLLATEYLYQNSITEKNTLELINIDYLKKGENEGFVVTDKKSASVYQVNFQSKSLGYSIFTPYQAQPDIFVQVLPDGSIYQFNYTKVGNYSKGLTEFPLKDYDGLLSSLSQAVLISLNEKQVSLSELAPNYIESVSVDKIILAYLKETQNSTMLYPIYVLSGKAQTKEDESTGVVLYVPAFSSN